MLERYGLKLPEHPVPSAADWELLAFQHNQTPEKGGLGRYWHLRNAIDLLHNEPLRQWALEHKRPYDVRKDDAFIWNDWSELMMQTFCEWQWVSVTGPNGSYKSGCGAMYALMAWLASPDNTIVILTSTSVPGLKKRIWKDIVRYHRALGSVGNIVQSETKIQFTKGSDESGIFGVATGQDGDVEKARNKIIGVHATNVIAICDEMQATNEALVKACISLEAGADRFQFIGLGNADSELDPHGQMSEPKEGWDSVSVEDETWETKRGICIHLDGLDSPRVKEGDEFYPGLLKQSNIESAIRDEGQDSPFFWQFRRGYWAPQGIAKTVLSVGDARKFRTSEPVVWVGKFTVGATLDPAYGMYDRSVLRQHLCGLAEVDGEEIYLLVHGEIVVLNPFYKAGKNEDPIHYQIATLTVEHCRRWGVTDEMFALDSTAEGEGPAGALIKEHGWGRLMRVDFNGSASMDPISDTNMAPAKTKYDRKVTELHFRYRQRVRNGQVRGLDRQTLLEFCQRYYEDRGNGIVALETKDKMRERTHRSPDLSDNAVMAEELFRKRGILKDPKVKGDKFVPPNQQWQQIMKKFDVRNRDLVLR